MSPLVATAIYALVIVGLFIIDRDRGYRPSRALWIPTIWVLITGSRPVSEWWEPRVSDSAAQHNVESDPINLIIFSLLLLSAIYVLGRRSNRVKIILQANAPVLLFFFYCAVSALWSDYAGAAIRKWVRSSGDLMVILILLTETNPTDALKRLFARTGFLLIPISIVLIKYYPDMGREYSNSWEAMFTGVTDHKNTLGMVCMIMGLGFWWRFLDHYKAKHEPRRRWHLLADLTILAMIGWLFRLIDSATSMSCFLMGSALITAASLFVRSKKTRIVHVLVALLIALPLFALFMDSSGGLISSLGRNPTLTGRTAIWKQVIALSRNPVVGSGFESFWLGRNLQQMWSDDVGAKLNEAHNGYLEVYLNLGYCGVALLALLIVTGYRNAIATYRRNRHLGSLMLAYFLVAIIYDFTEAGFRMLNPSWIFFLLATTAVPYLAVVRVPKLAAQPTRPGVWLRERERVI